MRREPLVTIQHYWQDFDADQIEDGEINAPTQHDTHQAHGFLKDLADEINHFIWWVGEWQGPAECTDDAETIYYNCQWPEGCGVGDPQYRSGSVHIDAAPKVRHALLKYWGVKY